MLMLVLSGSLSTHNPGTTHGKLKENSTENQWIIHRLSIDYSDMIHGLSIDNPWIITHASSTHHPSKGIPWISHESSMDDLWIIPMLIFGAI